MFRRFLVSTSPTAYCARPRGPTCAPTPIGKPIAKILVVDDDDSIRLLLDVLFKDEGHEVVQAADGVEACEAFDGDPDLDLIVLDVMMPRLDGYGVLDHVRGAEQNQDVAVVMLTAKGTKEDEIRAQKAGSDGYVTKPFDPDMLLGLVGVTLMYSPQARAEARVERNRAFLPEIADTGADGLS